jgi:molecular chaperone DnaK
MSWKDRAIELYKRFGAPAKFAAKMILGAALPGGSAVVDLVGEVLDCVHETAKDNLTVERASTADLQRVEEILAVLANELNPLMAQMTALADLPEKAAQVLDAAMATDEHCRQALHRLDHLARRFDRLEEQNKKLLEGQGYAAGMLVEMLPLMRRMVGVADYIDDLCTAGVSAADFRSCLHEFQDAARAFRAGRIAEAERHFQKAAQSQPRSAAAATALAGAKAAGQDFLAAEQSIVRAARLRPDDPELAELHRRVTMASQGAMPREQAGLSSAWRQPPKVGDTLDGWRLDLLLGHGGWGRVFKASRGSEVRALKVMHPELSRDPLFVERFKKEILNLAGLRGHKHLITIDNFGYAAEAACWYFVMELIEGMSLEWYLQRRGALTLRQARPLFLAVADGLAAAHERSIIHRDIKPANILLRRDGTPVLVDFGLAAVADDRGLTKTGRSAGYTAMFAAPEQLRSKPADVRSDIYSLAASLYYALVYDKPEHREPDQFEPKLVPEVLRDLLTSALHSKLERRPQTIEAFGEVLRATRMMEVIPPSEATKPQLCQKDQPNQPQQWEQSVATPLEPREQEGWLKISSHLDSPEWEQEQAREQRWPQQRSLRQPYIGIDFGIINSVVAAFRNGRAEVIVNHEGQKWTPSIVTLRRDGTLAFGQEAKENFDEQRSIRSIKRILGTPERIPFVGHNFRTEQIAVMLFSLLKRGAEKALNETFTKAVVTIPANSKVLVRHATKLCAGAAGMQVLTLCNEPTAAAICYGLNAQEDQNVLVYDFGGGTLDVTILHTHHGIFEEVSSKGIGKLGGDDVDLTLAKIIADRFQEKTGYDILSSPYKQQFMLAVERAKIDLSDNQTAIARKTDLVPERHFTLKEEIDRTTFERAIMPLIVKSGTAIDEALKLSGMRPKDIDKVLLVGDTTKIPMVRRYVAEKVGREPEPFNGIDPLTCKAQGAAIVSAILQKASGLDNYHYSVKLDHSLCAPQTDKRTGRLFLDPIIKRGTGIPCSYTKTYYPITDPADLVLISVYEGDNYDNLDSPENVKLAEIPWEFKPPRPRRDGRLEVTFEYASDGILTVQIHDQYAGQKKRFAIQQSCEFGATGGARR